MDDAEWAEMMAERDEQTLKETKRLLKDGATGKLRFDRVDNEGKCFVGLGSGGVHAKMTSRVKEHEAPVFTIRHQGDDFQNGNIMLHVRFDATGGHVGLGPSGSQLYVLGDGADPFAVQARESKDGIGVNILVPRRSNSYIQEWVRGSLTWVQSAPLNKHKGAGGPETFTWVPTKAK